MLYPEKNLQNDCRVVITGLGVIASIGIGKDLYWANLLKGKSGISPVSSFNTSKHQTHNGGEVKNFSPENFVAKDRLEYMNRATQMAVASARLACEDAVLSTEELKHCKVGISHGTTLGAAQAIEDIDNLLITNKEVSAKLLYQLPIHAAPSEIAKTLNCDGPNYMFSTACAAGNYAIAYAYDLIRLNRAQIVIAGASDAASRIEYTGFNQFSAIAPEKCQPFDKNRKGMIPAEGAGMLIVESLESALRRKVHIYAEIGGYGLSCDAYHMTTASIDGISACMTKAMRSAGIEKDEVSYISAHGTGTLANDRIECASIKEVFGPLAPKIPISSIKSMLGHTMGAASALEAVACALAVTHDMIPPTINYETPDPECDIDCVPNHARSHVVNIALNNSYAFGGNNASLVFKKFSY